jgi:hypothetical protein
MFTTSSQRLGYPFRVLQRTEEDPVELLGLFAAFPALAGGHQLHHAVVRENTEHDAHLRLEFILGERLEQDLVCVDVSKPSSTDGL